MSKSILIVEDEKVLRDVYEFVLKSKGFDVRTASNGIEAFHQIKQSSPDLILLDLFMPGMDGREFMRNYNTDEFPGCKIIVYTNLSDTDTEQEMLSLGADRFVLKSSLGPTELIELVNVALGDGKG